MKGFYELHFSVFESVAKSVSSSQKRIAAKIDTQVVNKTPKKSGQAQGGWIVTVDATTSYAPDAVVTENLAAGLALIDRANRFSTIYIQNNLPYIYRLNNGWSRKAPLKYVDKIVSRVLSASK